MRLDARAIAGLVAALLSGSSWAAGAACGDRPGDKPLYLTFDTGHMAIAPFVADVLRREQVHATFFLADEPTQTGGSSLDDDWAPFWRGLVKDGHAFGSHTADHVYWLADEPGGFRMKPGAGPEAGRARHWPAAEYCAQIERPAARFEAMTGARMLPLFRAPGGKTSPALVAAAKACGWSHVGWSPAGFLGDELPSDRYPNAVLLARALRDIRSGDVLLAHLGIWSRKDPWAPADLQPLLAGLKGKGFCFATLRDNPAYRHALR